MEERVIIEELKQLMNKAIKKKEVPVACIITKDNKIIAKSYNKTVKTNNILDHAEIIAIRKASKKLHNWRLNDCKMYISLEPCDMCKEIIKKSRLSEVIYYSKQNENKTEKEINYIFKEELDISKTLTNFFKRKR
ncbi:MAG: nucleoside deaminase [Bacilli bacterium]|nr:nucleoside deaminase [Bacilli bacterium]